MCVSSQRVRRIVDCARAQSMSAFLSRLPPFLPFFWCSVVYVECVVIYCLWYVLCAQWCCVVDNTDRWPSLGFSLPSTPFDSLDPGRLGSGLSIFIRKILKIWISFELRGSFIFEAQKIPKFQKKISRLSGFTKPVRLLGSFRVVTKCSFCFRSTHWQHHRRFCLYCIVLN